MNAEFLDNRKSYKPRLSLFWVRLISFVALALSMASVLAVLAYSVYSVNKIVKIQSEIELDDFMEIVQKRIAAAGPILNVMSVIKYISMAMIAITSFSLLYGSKNLNKMLIKRSYMAFASYIFLVFIIQYPLDYLLRKIFVLLFSGVEQSAMLVDLSVSMGTVVCATWFANTNVFIDIFIMTVFYFFLFKEIKTEQKWKIVLFRCCAIIPIIYVGGCMFLKNQSIMDLSKIGSFIIPLFATKKIPIYIFYLLTCLFFKIYKIKKQSVPSPMFFSIILSCILLVVSFVELIFSFFPALTKFGLGQNYLIIVGAPLIMLFNYKKSTMTAKSNIILFSIAITMFVGLIVWAGFILYQTVLLLIPIVTILSPYISLFLDILLSESE